jgi:hypothetical protein
VEIAAAVEQGVTWLPRTATADPGKLPVQDLPRVVPSMLHLLELPMLRAEDDDAGFYVAAIGGAGWRAAAILRSADGLSFEEIAHLDAPAVLGILPDDPPLEALDPLRRASAAPTTSRPTPPPSRQRTLASRKR